MGKIALVVGVTGQDGAYLSDLLLEQGYVVHGTKRRSSSFNTKRIDHLYKDEHEQHSSFHAHFGDVSDTSNMVRIIQEVQPDEIYNLSGQSHVQVSFEQPEYTASVNAMGTLRLLEAIRILKLTDKTKFYQASTSELFGKTANVAQDEKTPFYPRSPYAIAKLYAYWATINYREAYGIFASNGILFNHESPKRGETFVTRKITMGAAKIKLGLQKKLYLGNLSATRDWGHAKEYVYGMWRILQHAKPDDFVLATGKAHTVQDFVEAVFRELEMDLEWRGDGVDRKGIDARTGRVLVEVDPFYFRPTEADYLVGDSSKAKRELGWEPKITFGELVHEMVLEDLKETKKNYAQEKNQSFEVSNLRQS